MEKYGEKLASWAPGNLNRCHFSNSGSEANEMALKLVRSYWLNKGENQKTMILSRKISYHGATLGALSMSGTLSRRKEYLPYLLPYTQVLDPYCYHCPLHMTYPECNCACAYNLEEVINQIGSQYIGAFIAEPIQASAAAGVYGPPEYFKIIKEICIRHNILLIIDEVVTGFGRTGKRFAIDHWNIVPDIITFGKSAAAGFLALSGFIASDEIYETIAKGSGQFEIGHTFCFSPVAMEVGYQTLEFLEKNKLVEAANKKGAYLEKCLVNLMGKHKIIGDVRGKGMLWGVELVEDKEKRKPFEPEINAIGKMMDIAMELGLILYPSHGGIDGIKGDSIVITPPLIITNEQIDELIHLLEKSIIKLSNQLFK